MKLDDNRILAYSAEYAGAETDLALVNSNACCGERISDVPGADRAEQLALVAGLGGNLDAGELSELLAPGLSISELLGNLGLELGAALIELLDVFLGGHDRLPLRDEVVAGKTALDLDFVAKTAQVADLVKKNNFHYLSSKIKRVRPQGLSVLEISVADESQVASTLDGTCELALALCAGASYAARNDLAGLSDVILEVGNILVIDLGVDLRRHACELVTTEKVCHLSYPPNQLFSCSESASGARFSAESE